MGRQRARCSFPSFETRPCRALLRMRVGATGQRLGRRPQAIQKCLTLRSHAERGVSNARSNLRVGRQRARCWFPSFETRPYGALLRMREGELLSDEAQVVVPARPLPRKNHRLPKTVTGKRGVGLLSDARVDRSPSTAGGPRLPLSVAVFAPRAATERPNAGYFRRRRDLIWRKPSSHRRLY